MCDHGDTITLWLNGRKRDIDRCIVGLVNALNQSGFPTVASCCGHGQQPGSIALADGRDLVIFPTLEEGNRVVAENRYHENGPFAEVGG